MHRKKVTRKEGKNSSRVQTSANGATSSRDNQQIQPTQQHEVSRAILRSLGAKYNDDQNDNDVRNNVRLQSDIPNTDQKILDIVRHSLRPFSDRLDPFAQLPVTLNRFQEHLVSFYLLYYPKVIYGLSTRLRPHPVATNFSIAINNPPNFQVALARSALYRLSLHQYANEQEKHDLELSFMRHKGEAIKMVRELSRQTDNPDHTDNLVAAVISLGTLDRRTGSDDTASMHFAAVRRILRSVGGPLRIRSVLLSRVMVHFETIYGTATESYVWDYNNTNFSLQEINLFFEEIWNFWRLICRKTQVTSCSTSSGSSDDSRSVSTAMISPSILTDTTASFVLQADSALGKALSKQPKDVVTDATPHDRLSLIFQLTCLFTLCGVVMDLQHVPQLLKAYMSNLNDILEDAQLDKQPCNNHLWLIQIHDHTSDHSRRTWRAASFTWLMKRVDYDKQKAVRTWMLSFLMGEEVGRQPVMRLDPFHFSYAR